MALTNSESIAITAVLQFLLEIRKPGIPDVESSAALESAKFLADRAHRALGAGVTAREVEAAWAKRGGTRCPR